MRWLAVCALLLGAVYGADSVEEHVELVDDKPIATDNGKKARSFVEPTHGSANALTLTTYLTDAAHLHYAVLLSGHEPLDAAAIKAVAQSRQNVLEEVDVDATTRRLSGASNAVQTTGTLAVEANTVTVHKAQKVVSAVDKLQSNTSYDVYFVAEVIGSNGVFGPVQSVLQSMTHPEPPAAEIVTILPANASADTVAMNATLKTPGKVYFAMVPSGVNEMIGPEDLVANRSTGLAALGQVAFAVQTVEVGPGKLDFQKVVKGLSPATVYDVLIMTEAPGGGEVRSEVTRKLHAVRTHALQPELTAMSCAPLNSSATALDVAFQLEIHPDDLLRVTPETLSFFSYDLHYEVVALSDGASKRDKPTDSSAISSPTVGKTKGTAADISALKNASARGVFPMRNFSSVKEFRAGLKEMHHANITGLQSGTLYKVNLRAETAGSNGLFSTRELTAQATTHEDAPAIVAASTRATNKSVNSLTLTIELARSNGNIHYLYSSNSGLTSTLRGVFQQAKSMEHLEDFLQDRYPKDGQAYQTGLFKFSSKNASRPSTDSPTTAAMPGVAGTGEAAFTQEFKISSLKDATTYTIVLLPETTKSFGLFGKTYSTLLEATTNENASDVDLHSVQPVWGNTSSIEVEFSMSKTQDVLFMCLNKALLAGEDETAKRRSDSCREVEEIARTASNLFTFSIGNLSEDTAYRVSLYTENARRNGVVSNLTEEVLVRTHQRAPGILRSSAQPLAASTSRITAEVEVEADTPCLLHYAVHEKKNVAEAGNENRHVVDGASILKYASESGGNVRTHSQQRLPPSSASLSFVKGGTVFTASNVTNTFTVDGLSANTTYEVLVVTETSRDGNSSGVLGEPVACNVTTHAVAPKIVLATVDPVAGSIDSVVISANLSYPGVLHYFLSDVDFADPAVISHSDRNHTPHELRGHLQVLEKHILMEVINGTNDTRPTDPPVFVHNITVGGLKSGATYHVSLTTETRGSNGVYGEFPPPILVNTNLGPPVFVPETLSVRAVGGSSSALSIDFQLDRFGDVHYALFFRGLVEDRSQLVQESQKTPPTASNGTEGDKNDTIPVWPPPVSNFDLKKLDGPMLKAAELEELGIGVWVNDTISVSREDVTKGKVSHKEIDKLPPNALFDVCLVAETAASGGILGWPASGSAEACHRVTTHADYTNQSIQLDEIAVRAMDGRTDGIHISLNVSKLLKAPQTTKGVEKSVFDRFAKAAGRTPYFILLETKGRHAHDLRGSPFLSHRGEVTREFKEAAPGHGDGVVAAGVLTNITDENATALRIEQDVMGLQPNHEYMFFFAYETSSSDGVFTRINPHNNRSNDSRTQDDGIPVTTHEGPPRIVKSKARPTFGSTSMVSVKFDVACESCRSALVHLLVLPEHCKTPSSVAETLRLDRFSTVESNVTANRSIAAKDAAGDCKVPLVQKRVEFEMPERQHSRNDLEEQLGGEGVLAPNTSYNVLLATETVGSEGVISKRFEDPLRVRTHAVAPVFTQMDLKPRMGSTTELVLTFSLNRRSEVHYMLGISGNEEFNVTSPHNISSKNPSEGDRSGSKNVHEYRHDVVRTRRSVTYSDGEHIELLDHLPPGTSFDLFIVSETLPADHGVYGAIQKIKGVSTFANAPILLAHAAYPTPGTTRALTVGFRMDAPGIVYFSVVAVQPWGPTHHVAKGSDRYGNRLALKDRLVTQKSLNVDEQSMEIEHDSGWKEQVLEVPQTGVNYTIHLVTETRNSGGIYGTVATHAGVRAHSEAPELVDVSVAPTDARVDALTVNVTLSDRGHVHYIALPSGRDLSPPFDDAAQSTELAINARGSIDINETTGHSQEKSFTIAGLTEGTAYDLYFRSETFESFGVFGAWTRDPIAARTHGLPPDVLPDAVECTVTPSCEQRGREPCSRKANVCGECFEGYSTETDADTPDANEPCVKLPSKDTHGHRGTKIKINGVKRNPNLLVSEMEPQPESGGEQTQPQQPMADPIQAIDHNDNEKKADEQQTQQPTVTEEYPDSSEPSLESQEPELPSELPVLEPASQKELAQVVPQQAPNSGVEDQEKEQLTSSEPVEQPALEQDTQTQPEFTKLPDLEWTHDVLGQSELPQQHGPNRMFDGAAK